MSAILDLCLCLFLSPSLPSIQMSVLMSLGVSVCLEGFLLVEQVKYGPNSLEVQVTSFQNSGALLGL